MLKVLLVVAVLASVALATTSASKTLAPADKTVPVKPKKVRTFEPTYAPEPKPAPEPEEAECKPCKKKAAPPAEPEIKHFVPELTDGKLIRHHEKSSTGAAEPRTIEPQYVPEPVKAEDGKEVEKPKKKDDKERLPVVAEIKPEPPKRRRRCGRRGRCKRATFRNWRDAKRWLRSRNDDADNDNDKDDDRDMTSPPDMSGTTDGPVVAFARPVHGGLDDSDRVVDDATSADPEVPGTAGPADVDTAEPESDDKESQANRAAREAGAMPDTDNQDNDTDDKDEDAEEVDDDKTPAAVAAPAKF